MTPTSVSLLDRLRVADPEQHDWQKLDDLYRPLIHQWLARVPGLGDEAADLAQEVLVVLIREVPRFERRREGSFRAWLRQVTINVVRNESRKRRRQPTFRIDAAEGMLQSLADPNSGLAREWDAEHDRHVCEKLLAIVQADFQPSTWEAFRRCAVEGQPPARVAVELGVSENSVLLAKSRILKRLRTEAGELLG
jgi:RNA polymerase sigma-70 factor, ECF subfamily